MNGVSTLDLALAVHNAGAFPSISAYCYKDTVELINDLEQYIKLTNSTDLLLALDWNLLLDPQLFKAINQLKISHILFHSEPTYDEVAFKKATHLASYLNCKRVKIIFSHHSDEPNTAFLLKGSEGAGRPGNSTTDELFQLMNKSRCPIIPMGGIATAGQVKYYITNGADMVAVGTVFAAATESLLSNAAKQAIIASSKSNISVLDQKLKQNALLFNQVAIDDANHTQSLLQGINGNADIGHIFVGHGIEHITQIKLVKDIVIELVSEL